MEHLPISAPESGGILTVRMRVSLPVMHGGDYALTLAVAAHQNAELLPEDRVENALVFRVTETKPVVGWIRFTSEFSVE